MKTNYRRVYEYLAGLIERGFYKPGDQLPSITELAGTLVVGESSVKVALLLLREEGRIVGQQGKGTFVRGVDDVV
jgi:DNA-binding GntR family transcriptional regulator